MGDGKQFPKPESEIRFGWGMSYNYIGQLHHNLNKYDVIVGLEIPDFRTVTYYRPFSTQYYKSQTLNSIKCCMKLVLKFDQLT